MILILATAISSGCATSGRASQGAVVRAKEKVAPALVHIQPVKEVFRRGERQEVIITGSGFIISPDGYVVTNEHVAGKSTLVQCVLSDKEEVEAEVVGVDPFTDIAVLKLATDRTDLPYAKLGQSSELSAGQTVMALGSPHGLARSISKGIVSVTDRHLGGLGAPYNNWIQTDAAINSGNSGGPLVNLHGEVIGINTRKLSGADNVGFAIPIDVAADVVSEIIKTGRVTRSSIGVRLQEMKQKTDDPTQGGVVIADVDPLSPAYRAGLRPGDILLSVDDITTNARFTEDLPQVRKLIADKPVGEVIKLTVARNAQQLDLYVNTIELRQRIGDQLEFSEWGFTATALTPSIIRSKRLSSSRGIFVSGVQVGGLLAQSNMQREDVVLKIDDELVEDLASFKALYDDRVGSGQELVLLTIRRGALTMFKMLKQVERVDNDTTTQEGDG
jgi:serine protease Do